MGSRLGEGTRKMTGTALLAALVVIFDYALKYTGVRFPFPLMPTLKFDFTGVPILLSLFMYGPDSAFTTSVVAFAAILVRGGDVIGAAMKFLAEFATVLGVTGGLLLSNSKDLGSRFARATGWASGCVARVLAMSVANLYVLPNFYGMPLEATGAALPAIAAFNILQGTVSILLGLALYEAIGKRLSPPKRS